MMLFVGRILMMTLFLVLGPMFGFWGALSVAHAEEDDSTRPVRATLSAKQKIIVARIERAMQAVTTMSARFVQVSSDGNIATGWLYLSRPGRMRMEYDDPPPVLIVANGYYLIYRDTELDTTTWLDLDETLAYFLVRRLIAFNGDITLLDFEIPDKNTYHLTATQTERSEEGFVTMIFERDPIRLKEWIVTDSQQTRIRISLLQPAYGVELDPNLFVVPREFGKKVD